MSNRNNQAEIDAEIQSLFSNRAPIYKTIEELWQFCESHSSIYIYGVCGMSSNIHEYLRILGIKIKGYVVSDDRISYYKKLQVHGVPILSLNKVPNLTNIGFILGLPDIYYNEVIYNLRQRGFLDFLLVRDSDKLLIGGKIRNPTKETLFFGFSIVEHCNLGCKMCAAFAQLSDEKYMDIDAFKRDMLRLRELVGNDFSGAIILSGGEPLLHPGVSEFITLSRNIFPSAYLLVGTNGIKLLDMDISFWSALRECGFTIALTTYPINVDYIAVKDKANQFQVNMYATSILDSIDSNPTDKLTLKYPLDMTGKQPFGNFICCYEFNQFAVVNGGKVYACSILPFIHRFNKFFAKDLVVSKEDYLDIHQVKDFMELANFLSKPPAFCKYCDVKNRRAVGVWEYSKRTIDEYID
ncbi:MAG: radical SAM protein [Oscillospiraceae bacterium]|nr:radical SAM protein [Oscillospiraceae bacterium]